ncbi:MAG: hypothetical protein ACLR9T_05155 [Thomasclavelia sp.]|mgnify:CR=1 FL=1|uniref:hypothetical protein n=1 Tax=Thomasclavelia sp. TaxID=3025757 RepID=UPI0039A0254F
MLKLLKYEIIQSYRQYLLTFAIFLILCIMTPWLPDFISGILAPLLVFAFMGISIAINVNVILNFNRSMYKRPGYLTLTLPVSTNKLLAAKYLGSLIWVFIGYLVLAIGVIILSLLVGGVDFKDILEGGNILINALGENIGGFILQIVNYLAGISTMILSFFFVITLTKTKYIPKYKTVLGIGVYFLGLVLIANILSLIPIDNFVSNLSFIQITICEILSNCLFAGVFYFLTIYLIDHKIEVE